MSAARIAASRRATLELSGPSGMWLASQADSGRKTNTSGSNDALNLADQSCRPDACVHHEAACIYGVEVTDSRPDRSGRPPPAECTRSDKPRTDRTGVDPSSGWRSEVPRLETR